MNLVLLGLRASGKSELGKRAASLAGRPFVDLDQVTPGILGQTGVAEAWRRHGESEFRRAESVALRRVLEHDGQVVALGGGTPTAPGCADVLRSQREAGAILVYLHASPTVLRARMAASDNAHRPSLTGADPLAEIEAVYAVRDPLYRDLAGAIMNTEGQTVEALSALLAGLLARG